MATKPAIVSVPGGDPRRDPQPIPAAAADLVGPRQHRHAADRVAVAGVLVGERLEKVAVRLVQMTEKEDDDVGSLVSRRRREERLRLRRHLLRDRGDPRSVDQGQIREAGAGVGHLEVIDRRLIDGAEVDGRMLAGRMDDRGCVAIEGHRRGPRVGAVHVPRHVASALRGVGRGHPGANDGVEQGRLAGLDPPRNRQSERLGEPRASSLDHLEFLAGRLLCEIGQQGVDPFEKRGHRSTSSGFRRRRLRRRAWEWTSSA